MFSNFTKILNSNIKTNYYLLLSILCGILNVSVKYLRFSSCCVIWYFKVPVYHCL